MVDDQAKAIADLKAELMDPYGRLSTAIIDWCDSVGEEEEQTAGDRIDACLSGYPNFTRYDTPTTLADDIVRAYLSALPEQTGDLCLSDLRAANTARQIEWCPDVLPDLSFRGNELAGEAGEAIDAALDLLGLVSRLGSLAGRASNVIKKLERERHGWRGSRASVADLGDELADIVICADLCAITAGIDLAAAVRAKFNATSDKNGLSTRLPAPPAGESP